MNFYTSSILALILFYILLVIVMFFFQRSLLYHPSVDNYLKDDLGTEPTEIEKVNIKTTDNNPKIQMVILIPFFNICSFPFFAEHTIVSINIVISEYSFYMVLFYFYFKKRFISYLYVLQ